MAGFRGWKKAVLVEIEDEKGQRNFISVPVNSLYGDTMVFKGLNMAIL
ncbi:Hypothetical protein ACI5QN_04826 [Bacillus cereus]